MTLRLHVAGKNRGGFEALFGLSLLDASTSACFLGSNPHTIL